MNAVQGAGFRGRRPATRRGWVLAAALLGAVALARPAPAQQASAPTNQNPIAKAAADLTAAQDSPEARVIALHRHVRDEIRQVATQWG